MQAPAIAPSEASESGPVQPFRPPSHYVKVLCCNRQTLIVIIAVAVCTVVTGVLVFEPDAELRKAFEVCSLRTGKCKQVSPWKALVTGDVLVMAVVFMIHGARADLILFFCTILFGILGIITTKQAWSGFASTSNVVVQSIVVICRGIQDSGVLDQVFSVLLGSSRFRVIALLRSQALAAFMSALTSTTAVAIAGGPILKIWAPQANLASWEVMMPFVTAANMGQTMFTISSPAALIVTAELPDANIALLDPVPVSCALIILTAVYAIFVARPLLKPRATSGQIETSQCLDSPQDVEQASSSAVKSVKTGEMYFMSFRVSPGSLLIGRSPKQAGLLMLPGVELIGDDSDRERPLAVGANLQFAVTAKGLARLRLQGHGLVPQGLSANRGTLEALGGRRHQRRLHEAVVSPGSSLLKREPSGSLKHGVCLAARRPDPGASGRRAESEGAADFAGPLQMGDILLVEAFVDFPDLPETKLDFTFVAIVPDSAPPRHGRAVDTRRGWLALALLVGAMVLSTFQVADLSFLAMGVVALCVLFNIVHREMVLEVCNLPLYLLIAGGIGLGEAMYSSGLASALAKMIVHLGLTATPGSSIGMLIAISIITSGLSNMMSSTAVAALMCPIVSQICEQQNLSLKTAALLVMYSSNACPMTPFGSSANTIIQSYGPYQFADYTRYGGPLQLLYFIFIPLLCAAVFGMQDAPDPS